MSRWCTRQVFRCFKTVERIGDRITGAAGPVFVALAVVLLSIGAFCFCEHPSCIRVYLSGADDDALLTSARPPSFSFHRVSRPRPPIRNA